MNEITFQKDPITQATINSKIGTHLDGAIVTFTGRVRKNSRGREVLYLEYEIYEEMARKELQKIEKEAVDRWSLNTCIIIHRIGRVEISETSIFIAVSSPHRKESFLAAEFIIDEIKKSVPIWKKEFYNDGSEWISERS